jgi:hypothetical protein
MRNFLDAIKGHLMLRSTQRVRLEARKAWLQLFLARFGQFPDIFFRRDEEGIYLLTAPCSDLFTRIETGRLRVLQTPA